MGPGRVGVLVLAMEVTGLLASFLGASGAARGGGGRRVAPAVPDPAEIPCERIEDCADFLFDEGCKRMKGDIDTAVIGVGEYCGVISATASRVAAAFSAEHCGILYVTVNAYHFVDLFPNNDAPGAEKPSIIRCRTWDREPKDDHGVHETDLREIDRYEASDRLVYGLTHEAWIHPTIARASSARTVEEHRGRHAKKADSGTHVPKRSLSSSLHARRPDVEAHDRFREEAVERVTLNLDRALLTIRRYYWAHRTYSIGKEDCQKFTSELLTEYTGRPFQRLQSLCQIGLNLVTCKALRECCIGHIPSRRTGLRGVPMCDTRRGHCAACARLEMDAIMEDDADADEVHHTCREVEKKVAEGLFVLGVGQLATDVESLKPATRVSLSAPALSPMKEDEQTM